MSIIKNTGSHLALGLITIAALVLLTASATVLSSQTGPTFQTAFSSANEAYSKGDYESALQGYGLLLLKSGSSAGLNYNAGCAALKAGELGQAVVYFHRAARLAPRDQDIRVNLEFVQALTRPEDQEESTGNIVFEYISGLVFSLSTHEVSLLQLGFLLIFTLGAVLLAVGVSGTLRRGVIVIVSAGLFLLLINSAMLGAHIYRFSQVTEAVVVQYDTEALSGPGEDNTRVLVIPEGTVVRVRESRGKWALVSLPSGRSGWLKAAQVEEI
jgi:tetratricopeptide (TPR) repeat protein